VSVDLILMDYEMPRLSGPLAVEKLRSLGIVTPVVGVTGNVMKEESEYYIQCGADKVIHKPFTVKTLERALHELLLSRSKDPFERVFEHALK
jgi:CheY-like chemotaxis protein